MKSRVGFVSNSSTSSFIIKVDPYIADCYRAKGLSGGSPTTFDTAMSIASVPYSDEYGFDIVKNVLSTFEDKRNEIKYIYLELLRGCEFLQMPSENIYIEIDNCIGAEWEYLQDKSYSEIKSCDYFVEEMEHVYHEDYTHYQKVEKTYLDLNKLFDRDYRHIDTNKMLELGSSLIIMKDGRSLLVEKGIEPIWKNRSDTTEK